LKLASALGEEEVGGIGVAAAAAEDVGEEAGGLDGLDVDLGKAQRLPGRDQKRRLTTFDDSTAELQERPPERLLDPVLAAVTATRGLGRPVRANPSASIPPDPGVHSHDDNRHRRRERANTIYRHSCSDRQHGSTT